MLALFRQRNFALLWVAGLVDNTGDWILIGALPFYVYRLTGSALASGGMFTAIMLPGVLFGSITGVLVDRWDRRRVMIVTSLLNAALVLPLLGLQSRSWLWLIYVVAFLDAFLGLFFAPAKNALLPRIVGTEHLITANSLNGLNRSLSRLVGPALGGVLLGVFGLGSVVYADCLSFVLAGVLILGMRVRNVAPGAADETLEPGRLWLDTWRQWLEGLRLAARTHAIAVIFTVDGLEGLADGIFQVVAVVFVRQLLHGGPSSSARC